MTLNTAWNLDSLHLLFNYFYYLFRNQAEKSFDDGLGATQKHMISSVYFENNDFQAKGPSRPKVLLKMNCFSIT